MRWAEGHRSTEGYPFPASRRVGWFAQTRSRKQDKQRQQNTDQAVTLEQRQDVMPMRKRMLAGNRLATQRAQSPQRCGIHVPDAGVKGCDQAVCEFILFGHSDIPLSLSLAASALLARKQ
jgi:hypothetical protein